MGSADPGVLGRHLGGVVHPDIEDAGDHGKSRGGAEDAGDVSEDVPARAARDPQGTETQGLELPGRFARLAGVRRPELTAPDPYSAQIHGAPFARVARRTG